MDEVMKDLLAVSSFILEKICQDMRSDSNFKWTCFLFIFYLPQEYLFMVIAIA